MTLQELLSGKEFSFGGEKFKIIDTGQHLSRCSGADFGILAKSLKDDHTIQFDEGSAIFETAQIKL